MDWRSRITADPSICHGKPCIKGTRVLVSVILADLAAGESFESIMAGYHIDRDDIVAALSFAAAMAHDRYLPLPEAS